MGREIEISSPIERVISLVPSQTELLFDLGLASKIVGRTRFCIHPKQSVSRIPIIGGSKNFNLEKIRSLKPDLIIGNKEENKKDLILELEKSYPVWLSNVLTFEDSLVMIKSVSQLFEKCSKGNDLINRIIFQFNSIPDFNGHTVLYLIWSKPYMGVGTNTFINSILEKLGLKNVLQGIQRYPQLTDKQINRLKPDFVFLSSEPFPFKAKHKEKIKELTPNSSINFVNGEMFSWYGSRLLQAPNYFKLLFKSINE
ncbi:ABC transporter substrate-binding protein [Hyphobacterium sp. CCMP332]|nr:ABC transporter substrate-binding protein [Hyphobacterium sp. CCMP332]